MHTEPNAMSEEQGVEQQQQGIGRVVLSWFFVDFGLILCHLFMIPILVLLIFIHAAALRLYSFNFYNN